MTTKTKLTTTQLLEAMAVLSETGMISIVDKDPVKVDNLAKSKNGKTVVVKAAEAISLTTRYKALEIEQANAEAKVKAFKTELQNRLGDATELMVEGMTEPIATWRWGALTNFDKDGARKEAPELIEKYTTTDPEGKRTFRFPGVHVS